MIEAPGRNGHLNEIMRHLALLWYWLRPCQVNLTLNASLITRQSDLSRQCQWGFSGWCWHCPCTALKSTPGPLQARRWVQLLYIEDEHLSHPCPPVCYFLTTSGGRHACVLFTKVGLCAAVLSVPLLCGVGPVCHCRSCLCEIIHSLSL